ncbi:DUF6542 domain-containing protein [Streptomyces sp. NPDC096136]|uniref:DUF6542 domain-containing protein n=1 Tax=Streptomyces sp. NPDC096136 TaxID=3366076 RepID=UPI00380AFA53
MERYRTRSVRHPQVPAQAARRPRPPVPAPARRMPRPRLTGLGGGLFACVAMLLVAGIAWLLFDSSLFVYGLLFLPVAAATALWVRPADLITAPVCVPIAFAAGVWPVSGGSGGFGGELMGVVSALSLHAGWLYAGTLVAGLIALARRAALSGRRRAAAARRGSSSAAC